MRRWGDERPTTASQGMVSLLRALGPALTITAPLYQQLMPTQRLVLVRARLGGWWDSRAQHWCFTGWFWWQPCSGFPKTCLVRICEVPRGTDIVNRYQYLLECRPGAVYREVDQKLPTARGR